MIIPEIILDHKFRGKSYDTFQKFKEEVVNYLNDRSEPMVLRVCTAGAVEVDYRAHYVYVDNIGVFAVTTSRTRELLDQIMKRFNGIGLEIREDEIITELGESLGNRIELKNLESALTRKRFSTVRKGLEYALSRRSLPGAIWLIVIGPSLSVCS